MDEASTSSAVSPSTHASEGSRKPDWRDILGSIDWESVFGEQLAADETMAKVPKMVAGMENRAITIVCRSADGAEIFRETVPYECIAWSKTINGMFKSLPVSDASAPIEVPIVYDPETCEWTPYGIATALKYCDARVKHASEPIRKYADRAHREIRPNYEGWEYKFMADMGLVNLKTVKPLYELFMSAQYLNIRDLIQLVENILAFCYIITLSTEQQRKFFGFVDDMTPEEHTKIDEEFAYIDL